jgi:hypothetical protein
MFDLTESKLIRCYESIKDSNESNDMLQDAQVDQATEKSRLQGQECVWCAAVSHSAEVRSASASVCSLRHALSPSKCQDCCWHLPQVRRQVAYHEAAQRP